MCNTQTILLKQYDRAIDLYVHEDELVWKKISQMVGFNFALLAALGFVLTKNQIVGFVEYFICIVGLTISFGFYLAIASGIKFMIRRRDQAKSIEEILEGAQLVMRSGPTKASTQAVQPYAAWLFIVIWFTLLIITIIFPEWITVQKYT